ncbi:MAG TPA: histone deacetylase, partial [Desulfobacteria bacterium]|nr:histone deacetylase [Desulfobacteria bacterium]
GDGTQDIYWHDPNTLFISIHQDGRTLYPGSGFPDELGGPNAQGKTVNIPLPPQTGERGFLYTLDELVMPLLEEFKPELVINSAGQDNHFNDPITNMNFSARGYASLNARLKPDIAVLEGGYAIQNALPYVNVGIIMAMAGMDTSFVKEPNYEKDYRPQSTDVTRHIEQLVEALKDLFLRGGLKKKTYDEGQIVERKRDIFYDTDGIQERQNERIRCCSHCAGAFAISSTASTGQHIMGVHIPMEACPACRKSGLEWFDAARKGAFRYVYLQDRDRGLYEVG